MPVIPPFVPGTALLLGAIISWVLGSSTVFDPAVAATWTDRGTILAILAIMFISWAIVLRYIAALHKSHQNATVGAINENTGVTRQMLASLNEHLEFQRKVMQKAITDRLEIPTPHRTRVHTTSIRPRDIPNNLPKAEE